MAENYIDKVEVDGQTYPVRDAERENYSPKTHSHAAGDINDGTLPIARGGTGSSSASAARSALGAQAAVVKKTGSLTVAGWSGSAQVLSVTGVTSSSCVIVAPAPDSLEAYAAAGVRCTAQASGQLTFTSQSVPTEALTVNVAIL